MVVTSVQEHISDSLAKCGYPQWALICTGPTVKPLDAEPKKEEDQAKGFVTIPYVKGVSEKIRQALGKQKITTTFKPMGSIKSTLVHPKDKFLSRIKDNLVYEATCSSCDATYIGETQQPLHKRVYQHATPNSSSVIADHTRQSWSHALANFQILEREDDWGRKGIREAIQECICSPTLNQNKGLRYCLSHEWDRPLWVSWTSLPPDNGHRNNVRNVDSS